MTLEASALERGALLALLYYHMFRFPLREAELLRLCHAPVPDLATLQAALVRLVEHGLVRREGAYHFLGDPSQVREREEGEVRAARTRPRAEARARLIAAFPFVRAVCLSGTISKGVLGPRDDVDFFVVTAPDRVWICRTLLMLFKKTLLLNSHRLFCVNYLVADDKLALPDLNVFTATELAWLVPVSGRERYDALVAANGWIGAFLPNWRPPTEENRAPSRASLGKRAVEALLAGARGDWLDERCRVAIARRNRARYAHLTHDAFGQAMRATRHASKHHPLDFQSRILDRFGRTVASFERETGLMLRDAPADEAGAA